MAVGVAVAVAAAALVLDMSKAAPRTAGSDHVAPYLFTPAVPANGTICQPLAGLPRDAARVQMTVASYGRPMPELLVRFRDRLGVLLAAGRLPAGAREGVVSIPIHASQKAAYETASEACLTGRGPARFTVGAEGVPLNPASARIKGALVGDRVSLVYFRAGAESWWELLPTLTKRFGLGKSDLFGSWLLPFAALALLAVWVASIRLLIRQLR